MSVLDDNGDSHRRTIRVLDGAMNPQMKQTIRPKIESYVKRAEEIKNIMKNGAPKKKAVADSANGRSKDNKGDDDESGDPERKRMMQRFEGELSRVPLRSATIYVRSDCHGSTSHLH